MIYKFDQLHWETYRLVRSGHVDAARSRIASAVVLGDVSETQAQMLLSRTYLPYEAAVEALTPSHEPRQVGDK